MIIYIRTAERQGFGHCVDQNKMEGPNGRTKVEISVQLTVLTPFKKIYSFLLHSLFKTAIKEYIYI